MFSEPNEISESNSLIWRWSTGPFLCRAVIINQVPNNWLQNHRSRCVSTTPAITLQNSRGETIITTNWSQLLSDRRSNAINYGYQAWAADDVSVSALFRCDGDGDGDVTWLESDRETCPSAPAGSNSIIPSGFGAGPWGVTCPRAVLLISFSSAHIFVGTVLLRGRGPSFLWSECGQFRPFFVLGWTGNGFRRFLRF